MGYSILTQNGAAGFGPYPVNFTLGYLRREYVQLRVNDERDGLGNPIYRTISWLNDGFVQITSGVEPTSADTVILTRTVPKTVLQHDYQDGALIIEQNLDESNLQNLMAIHEFLDGRFPDDTTVEFFQILLDNLANGNIPAVAQDLLGPDTIGTVASNLVNINLVAAEIPAVVTVASNMSAVLNVSTNMAVVQDVSNNMSEVLSVDAELPAIVAVNANETNINTVATNSTPISTVATNITAVQNASTNMAAILDAPNQASDAADSAIAADDSASLAEDWATLLGGEVDGSENSSKAYAQEDLTVSGRNKGGSAKDWAEAPEDSEVSPGSYSAKHWAAKSLAAAGGGLVKISSNDTTADYLGVKLSTPTGGGISLTEDNNGGNETLAVALNINSLQPISSILPTNQIAIYSGGNHRRTSLENAFKSISEFVGDSGAGGAKGLVPAPASGDAAANKVLKADGTWGSQQVLQTVYVQNASYGTTTIPIPYDDTIPQISEGLGILEGKITPKSASSKLLVIYKVRATVSGKTMTAAAFLNGGVNAVDATDTYAAGGAHKVTTFGGEFVIPVEDTDEHTINIRVGAEDTTSLAFNGGNSGRRYGGAGKCTLVIMEIV